MHNLQKTYINYLKDISKILESIKFDNLKQEELISKIEQTRLIIPVVGGFSAGKSTLINSFLGKDILSTGITPETALATELRYSKDNYFEAVKIDGEFDKFDIKDLQKIKENASKYQFLRLYLDNENLKSISPLILVDMPGFDSPLDLHNKAILNYLSKGKYFVVLISAEDGNITKSILREIDNIMEFGKGFSFCISKSNLKSPSDIKLIKDKIVEQLSDSFDYDKDVLTLGKDDGSELDKILKSIDSKELFQNLFIDELKNNNFEIQGSINTTIATLKNTEDEIKNAINELKLGIDKISTKKQRYINELKNKYSDNGVNTIITSVTNAINSNLESLASLAVSNQESFKSELNSIIKSSLIKSIKDRMSDLSIELVDSFSLEIKGLNLDGFKIDDKWLENLANSTKKFLQKTQSGLNVLADNINKSGKLYKTITVILGLATSVINPLLEIIIVFLPELISFFSKGEKNRLDQAKNQIIGNIIPSIKTRLREEIPTLLNEQIRAMIDLVSVKFDEELRQKEDEISKTSNEKSNDIKEVEAQILGLKNANEQIKNLASDILYKRN